MEFEAEKKQRDGSKSQVWSNLRPTGYSWAAPNPPLAGPGPSHRWPVPSRVSRDTPPSPALPALRLQALGRSPPAGPPRPRPRPQPPAGPAPEPARQARAAPTRLAGDRKVPLRAPAAAELFTGGGGRCDAPAPPGAAPGPGAARALAP
nr:basic proline-rich protein-like [Manis javanica]